MEQKEIRLAAMDLLARREHARKELEKKLRAKFPDEDQLVDLTLDQLREDGLQSDQRFGEAYSRSRVNRGYGERAIRHELIHRGLDEHCVADALSELDVDWFELALDVLRKKFGDTPADDLKEKARRQRFLNYRGFSGDQIRYALESIGVELSG